MGSSSLFFTFRDFSYPCKGQLAFKGSECPHSMILRLPTSALFLRFLLPPRSASPGIFSTQFAVIISFSAQSFHTLQPQSIKLLQQNVQTCERWEFYFLSFENCSPFLSSLFPLQPPSSLSDLWCINGYRYFTVPRELNTYLYKSWGIVS